MTKIKYINKYRYALYIVVLIIVTGLLMPVHAQNNENITAKGTITDTTGSPLIGVTVMVKGTTKGTITDANGNFAIDCAKGSTIKVSFIGYKSSELEVAGQALSIKLIEENVNLDEVVVVGIGYGTMRKSDLTGAISSVSSDKFNQGVITTSEQLIQGKVAGLTISKGSGDPSQGVSIRLRGGTSLTASNGPLYVIDGIPGADINTISPSDIQSIDILKDASAAAIYGSRGANGVIIVTTKKGNTGKTRTEYNGYVAIGKAAKNYDMLSANQWRAYVRENKLKEAVDYGGDTNWQEAIEQTSVSHSHNLSMDGGNDKSNYRASLGYLDNQGIIITSYLKRLTGSIDINHKALNDKLNIELNLSTSFDTYNPILGNNNSLNVPVFERALNLNPTIPIYDKDGNYTEVDGLAYENPVAMLKQRTQKDTRHRFLGFTKFDLQIIEGLKATANLSYTLNSHESRFYTPSTARLEGKEVQGRGRRTLDDGENYQLETYLNYDKAFGDHAFNLMGGYSYLLSGYEGFGAQRSGFSTDLFEYNSLGSGTDAYVSDVYSYKGAANLISFFGRFNYNFKSRYMFTATIRRDGSSRFGKDKKWGVFPSASIAWRVSDESILENAKGWLTNLKLRAGYGITGNQDGIGEYKSIVLFGQSSDDIAGYTYFDGASGEWKIAYGPTQNENKLLQWEQTAQLNVGVDFGFFNRFNGTIEYYNKKTSNLLFNYAVRQPPYLTGKMLANVGDLSNKGLEVTLNTQIIRSKNFTWNVDVNFAYNTQKIDKLSNDEYTTGAVPQGLLTGIRGMSSINAQSVKEGYVAGTFFGPICEGIDSTGNYIIRDTDGDGKITDADADVIGDVQPDYTAGLGMSFSYKNLDLNFFFNGIFGQKLLNASYMSMMNDTRIPVYNVPDAALTDNITVPPVYCSYWIEDGSFIRLQNVSLGYTLPLKDNNWVKKARLFATAENLFVITDYSGLDPEISLDGLEKPGIEKYDSYPKARTFSFGLSVTF